MVARLPLLQARCAQQATLSRLRDVANRAGRARQPGTSCSQNRPHLHPARRQCPIVSDRCCQGRSANIPLTSCTGGNGKESTSAPPTPSDCRPHGSAAALVDGPSSRGTRSFIIVAPSGAWRALVVPTARPIARQASIGVWSCFAGLEQQLVITSSAHKGCVLALCAVGHGVHAAPGHLVLPRCNSLCCSWISALEIHAGHLLQSGVRLRAPSSLCVQASSAAPSPPATARRPCKSRAAAHCACHGVRRRHPCRHRHWRQRRRRRRRRLHRPALCGSAARALPWRAARPVWGGCAAKCQVAKRRQLVDRRERAVEVVPSVARTRFAACCAFQRNRCCTMEKRPIPEPSRRWQRWPRVAAAC